MMDTEKDDVQEKPQQADTGQGTVEQADATQAKPESLFKRALKGFLLSITMLLLAYMVGVFAYGVWSISTRILQKDAVVDLYMTTIFDHFAATVGLSFAALGSLCLVLLLRYSAGPIEFEGMGFKFKGASGPIILWVICFLAMVSAIKLLW
jgi:hypothetical protein